MSDEAGGSTYTVSVTGVSLQGDQMARAAHSSPVKWTSFKGQPEPNRACHDRIFTGLGLCRSSIVDNFFFTFGNSEGRTVLWGRRDDREILDGCWQLPALQYCCSRSRQQQAFWEPVIQATKRIGKNRITA